MKRRLYLGVAVAIVALAIGIAYGTVSSQDDKGFNMNMEALSSIEYSTQCHPINLLGGHLWINTVVCLNDKPGHCAYPHSTYVNDSTQDCVYLDY